MKKFRCTLYISYLLFCIPTLEYEISILSDGRNESFLFLLVYIMRKLILVGIVYLFIVCSMISVSHLSISCYYKVKGYGFTPIIMYPFVILPHEKKVRININFLDMGKYLFSPQFVMMKSEKNDQRVIISCKAYLFGFLSQMVSCLYMASIFFMSGDYEICLSMVVLLIALIVLAYTNVDSFKGLLVLRKEIKSGKLPLYLANQMILYSSNSHEVYKEFVDLILMNSNQEDLVMLQTVKHIYMLKCYNNGLQFEEEEEEYLKTFLLKDVIELWNPLKGDEKFSILKVYLYSSIINKDKAANNLAVFYLKQLDKEYTSMNAFIGSPFVFYCKLGMGENLGERRPKNYRKKILRGNILFQMFENYRQVNDFIVDIMCMK